MAKVFLVHGDTGRRFEILHINRETGKMKLRGPRAEFEEDYDPPQLKQRGYTLKKEPDDAEQQGL